MKVLMHRDIYLPEAAQEQVIKLQKCTKRIIYSNHLKDHLAHSRDRSHNLAEARIKSVINGLINNPHPAFEIEAELRKDEPHILVNKACVRASYSVDYDLVVVFHPITIERDGKFINTESLLIVTAWLNNPHDHHNTLDESRYYKGEGNGDIN